MDQDKVVEMISDIQRQINDIRNSLDWILLYIDNVEKGKFDFGEAVLEDSESKHHLVPSLKSD